MKFSGAHTNIVLKGSTLSRAVDDSVGLASAVLSVASPVSCPSSQSPEFALSPGSRPGALQRLSIQG